MRRNLVIVSMLLAWSALTATPASAIDESDANSEVTIVNPARVDGTLWVDSRGAYLVASRALRCWYPQEWYDDVVILDVDDTVAGFNSDSIYHDYVVNMLGADPGLFGDVALFSSRSCIQDAYIARGDCSSEDRIAVLASYAVRDAFLGQTSRSWDFDFEDRNGLYCLVVIERDPWLDLVRDRSYVPPPIRATYPQYRTLVGLDNHVWYDVLAGTDRTRDGFSVDLPTSGISYSLTLDIWLTEIRVDIDSDGSWDLVRECPDPDPEILELCAGSVDSPVYTFQYESRALHPFTIETRWSGQAVDPDGIVLEIDPNLLMNQYTFGWETVEVRSSLDG
ncbi:MAG: hypothetical protein QNJ77_06235 [Acidimicrobiia bacterium]|nr:hypothetical protein [Acidimicrobiia bacterium]